MIRKIFTTRKRRKFDKSISKIAVEFTYICLSKQFCDIKQSRDIEWLIRYLEEIYRRVICCSELVSILRTQWHVGGNGVSLR